MKKIKNIWSIICRSSSVDIDTNIISLFEIVEEITITSNLNTPNQISERSNIVPFPFELVSFWERFTDVKDVLSLKMKISVVNPSEEEKEQAQLSFNFPVGKKRMRVRIKVPGLSFTKYGLYTFKIYLEEDNKFNLVQEIPLEIKSEVKIQK